MIDAALEPLRLSSANGGVRAFHWARRTFILLCLFAVFIVLIAVWPYDPVTYNYIQMETPFVKSGDVVIYKLWMDKKTNLTPIVTRTLQNMDSKEDQISVTGTVGMARIGDPYKRIYVGVPSWIKPGRYIVRNVVTYPYWGGNVPVSRDYRTGYFTVIPNDLLQKVKENAEDIKSFANKERARGKVEVARDKDYRMKTRLYEQRDKAFRKDTQKHTEPFR